MKPPAFDHQMYPKVHPVFVACHEGDLAKMEDFLGNGVSAEIEDALHPDLGVTALSFGHVAILRLLLAHGLKVNAPRNSFGRRLLHLVSGSPRASELAGLLLDAGADPNVVDQFGLTPVIVAAAAGDLPLVRLLAKAGADLMHVPRDGNTAFFCAAKAGREECATFLLAHGAAVNEVDDRGRTALASAAMTGNIRAVKWLLAHGADKTILDDFDNTALDWAQENGHAEVVKLLS